MVDTSHHLVENAAPGIGASDTEALEFLYEVPLSIVDGDVRIKADAFEVAVQIGVLGQEHARSVRKLSITDGHSPVYQFV